MLHTKFRENRPTGSGEEDFSRVFTIYGRGSHLSHVTSIMSSDFHFLIPGPRSSNDLDLQYSHTFIYSIRCLLLPTFRSLAAIVSEKSTVFTFSYRKAYVTKFDLAVK